MQSLLKMLESSGDSNGVQEDALLAVGTLTEVVGDKFMNYFDVFKQYLVKGLQNKAEYQVSRWMFAQNVLISFYQFFYIVPYADFSEILMLPTYETYFSVF